MNIDQENEKNDQEMYKKVNIDQEMYDSLVEDAKNLTLRELFAAIRKNGYPKIKRLYARFAPLEGDYPENTASLMVAGCAIGQAAANLNQLKYGSCILGGALGTNLHTTITILNDETDLTLSEIADQLEKDYANQLDLTLREVV